MPQPISFVQAEYEAKRKTTRRDLYFRHLLGARRQTVRILELVKPLLRERRPLLAPGPLVDTCIIEAPSSIQNKDHARDPKMHQTKNGNHWDFGMKTHTGADAEYPGATKRADIQGLSASWCRLPLCAKLALFLLPPDAPRLITPDELACGPAKPRAGKQLTNSKTDLKECAIASLRSLQRLPRKIRSFFQVLSCQYATALL